MHRVPLSQGRGLDACVRVESGDMLQVESSHRDPARDEKDRHIRSGLIAALSSDIIGVVTGGGVGSAIGAAVIVGLMTAALSF